MATTKITNPELFDLGSLDTALKLPSGTTAERPTSPSTGEWRYNTTTNLVEFWDGGEWRDLQSEDIPPINSENFNTVLYTGNGTSQSITGVGFKPDWIWIKERTSTSNNVTFDSTRGIFEQLYITTDAESNNTSTVSSFDSDGFSLNSGLAVNENGQDYVAWCWKANGGTTSSNTDGSITSTVQANTKAGFSIITWAGTGGVNTVGHGLNSAPELILIKGLSSAGDWQVYSSPTGNGNKLVINSFAAQSSTTRWNSTSPTSSVFTLNDSGLGTNLVAYAFQSVAQYSSIGTYTGNSSDNGPIVETGFEPAFLIIKNTSDVGSWFMYDNKRNTSNPRINYLLANASNVEASDMGGVDFLSNGFQIKDDHPDVNDTGDTYLYIAFASDPSTAPVLADSFTNKLYTGTGVNGLAVTGLGFKPSMVWIKNRGLVRDHNLADIIQGVSREITPNTSEAQENRSVTSFDSDGFTLDNASGNYNANGNNYVAWNWKANPTPTINTDGTIQSIVSANQASGISIIQYTGTGSAGTVGHGLSAKCDMVIIKTLNSINNWIVQLPQLGDNARMLLDNTSAKSDDSTTAQAGNATVFGIGADNSVAKSGDSFIAYCFTSISGFSKIESYTGNGSTNGPIVTTGFQPDWIMIKRTDAAGTNWNIMDSLRGNSDYLLAANTNAAEVTNETPLNTTSTGFEITEASDYINASGGTYIYMAFKENPVQYAIPSGEMGYLVAAGGGGSSADSGGGAGAGGGGLRTTYGLSSGGGASAETNLTLATGTYTITVGAGGAAYDGSTTSQNGVASTITGNASVSTVGGGAAGDFLKSGTAYKGNDGGSGGGSANSNGALTLAGGAGTANEGFAGGAGSTAGGPGSDSLAAGGGGGAAQVGTDGALDTGGNGGNGLTVAITGTNEGYAGGGGGGCRGTSGTTAGQGGNGGGGNAVSSGDGNPGTANTGGGGGGGRANGANGGSGVVVLRMNTSDFSGTTSGSPTISAIGSETILQYLASGSYVHNPSTAAGQMNYMVLAGGASGASNGGGGGSGGLRSSWYASGGGAAGETPLTLSSGTYTITIGGGGAETTVYQNAGNNGTATTISGNATVNTVGGGGGGSNNNSPLTGGSGGGSGSGSGGPTGAAGTAGEGFAGGNGMAASHPYTGGGGGGTGVVGGGASSSAPGAGGNGAIVSITGTAVSYGGGGGGTGGTGIGYTGPGGVGGTGGGGAGGAYNTTGIAATVNTGGGGGASGDNTGVGGAGGSGIVILRLITSEYSGTTTGSPTVTTEELKQY